MARLNDRKREVAIEIGRGQSNAEISANLHLSIPTVKTHVSAILTKLALNNRVQIALLAHDVGLDEDDSRSHSQGRQTGGPIADHNV
jgi:DNA-binding NarL/FixJ family response regulator